MTADHCIQIAAIITGSITPFAVLIWGPALASRINHPTPKDETAPPPKKSWYRRALKSYFFWFPLGILLNIFSLYLDLRSALPITPHRVLLISWEVGGIGVLLMTMFMLRLVDAVGKLRESHIRLIDFVGGIAEVKENSDSSQT
jgi:hypothetical protein